MLVGLSAAPRACATGALLAAAVGCGSTHSRPGTSSPGPPLPPGAPASVSAPSSCADTVAGTLATVGTRVYREAQSGSNATEARRRIERSSVLSGAVARGDGAAAGAALRTLMAGQIIRIEVSDARRVLAGAGHAPAIAPVVGVLRGPTGAAVGSYRLSVENEGAFVNLLQGITGSQVRLSVAHRMLRFTPGFPSGAPAHGPVRVDAHRAYAVSLPVQTFGGASASTTLLTKPPPRCVGDRAQISATTLGEVARRIYDEEAMSTRVRTVQARIGSSTLLRRAVARRDPLGARQAIVALFRSHVHVVRVRVSTRREGLLVDVGGPDVLAPVTGPLRDRTGRTVGTLVFALQDDAGYVKLVRRFTGAEVTLRRRGRLVPSVPAPRARHGRAVRVFSFTGTAFPAGELRISVLIGD